MTKADAKVLGYSPTPSLASWWLSALCFSDGLSKIAANSRSRRSVDPHHYRQPGVQGTGAARLLPPEIIDCVGSVTFRPREERQGGMRKAGLPFAKCGAGQLVLSSALTGRPATVSRL